MIKNKLLINGKYLKVFHHIQIHTGVNNNKTRNLKCKLNNLILMITWTNRIIVKI